MIIQLLYDIPFGKQEKMRACFLSRFLVWMLFSLKKKALYCTKEDVECLHVTLLSNYGIFKIPTQQKKNLAYRKTLCNCTIQMLSSYIVRHFFAKSVSDLQLETTPIVG